MVPAKTGWHKKYAKADSARLDLFGDCPTIAKLLSDGLVAILPQKGLARESSDRRSMFRALEETLARMNRRHYDRASKSAILPDHDLVSTNPKQVACAPAAKYRSHLQHVEEAEQASEDYCTLRLVLRAVAVVDSASSDSLGEGDWVAIPDWFQWHGGEMDWLHFRIENDQEAGRTSEKLRKDGSGATTLDGPLAKYYSPPPNVIREHKPLP